MPDALRLQFLRLFNGACDAAVRRDDVPVEQHPVMSGYGHGRYQCLFQPLPFGLDAFRVAAFLVGVYIVNQDAVRAEVLVTCTTGRLPGSDGAEGTSRLAGKFPCFPRARLFLRPVVLYDTLVLLEIGHEGQEQTLGVVLRVGDEQHVAHPAGQRQLDDLHHGACGLGQLS